MKIIPSSPFLYLTLLAAVCLMQLPVQAAGTNCDRACLEGMVENYLDAVIDNTPQRLALAKKVRFTENGQRLEIGDGLWNTMKDKGQYRLWVTDPEAGQVAVLATVYEDHQDPAQRTPVLLALRLKIRAGRIAEAEHFVVRNTNFGPPGGASINAAERVEAMGRPHAVYTEVIPEAERMSRKDLIITADKYFSGLQLNDGNGDYPFTDDCNRLENGMQSTNVPTPAGETRPDPATANMYSGQWSCLEQFQSGLMHFVNRIRDRRFVAVDRERGIVFAFAFFDHSGGATRTFQTPSGRTLTAGPVQPWTWELAELFKIEKGKIRKIEAILERCPYGMNSGWSDWKDGMSDRIQDVTMH
jgi:hypothetical protein